jgi:hypothetical protein
VEPLVKRTEKGQFAPGQSGNISGRPKSISPVVALAREHTVAAVQALAEIAVKGKNESARTHAATALLDRAWGRPAQSIELDLQLTKSLATMTLEELQQLRERYAAFAITAPATVIDHDASEEQPPSEDAVVATDPDNEDDDDER